MTEPDVLEQPYDFSLVLGGPIFQLFRRSHLTGDGLELLYRRLLIITLLAWLPLVLLTTFSSAAGSVGRLSFFHDVEVHVRFLIALPVLIAAELIVHSRIRPVVRSFIERRIILPQDRPRFRSAIESATRLRNFIPAEVGILVFVYTFGLWLWHGRIAIDAATWYANPGGRWNLTPAGFWYVFVSIPILQFILLRWYLRLFIWFRFLWHVQNQPKPHCDSPRPRCRSRLPGQECLRLRSDSFRSGSYARRSGCQSSPLQGGELNVVQVTGRRLCGLFRAGPPLPALDVYSPDGSRKEERTGGVRP